MPSKLAISVNTSSLFVCHKTSFSFTFKIPPGSLSALGSLHVFCIQATSSCGADRRRSARYQFYSVDPYLTPPSYIRIGNDYPLLRPVIEYRREDRGLCKLLSPIRGCLTNVLFLISIKNGMLCFCVVLVAKEGH